jgi:hypothetical protein
MSESEISPKLSLVLIHLFKGILFRNEQPNLWEDLLNLQTQVLDYVKVLGLKLEINETEGYAWLTQYIAEDENSLELPRLISRRPLSFQVSLLCVLLRKRIVEADKEGGQLRVIVSRQELQNAMLVFMPEKSNEAQINEQINTTINKVIELGFLRKLKDGEQLEIQRIISALVDADWLGSLDEKLASYTDYANRTA